MFLPDDSENRIEIALVAGLYDEHLAPKGTSRCPRVVDLRVRHCIVRIDEKGDRRGGRNKLVQQLQLLRDQNFAKGRDAGEIAARLGEAGDQSPAKTRYQRPGSYVMIRTGVGSNPLQGLYTCAQFETMQITSRSATRST